MLELAFLNVFVSLYVVSSAYSQNACCQVCLKFLVVLRSSGLVTGISRNQNKEGHQKANDSSLPFWVKYVVPVLIDHLRRRARELDSTEMHHV